MNNGSFIRIHNMYRPLVPSPKPAATRQSQTDSPFRPLRRRTTGPQGPHPVSRIQPGHQEQSARCTDVIIASLVDREDQEIREIKLERRRGGGGFGTRGTEPNILVKSRIYVVGNNVNGEATRRRWFRN